MRSTSPAALAGWPLATRRVATLAFLLASAAACGGDSPTDPTGRVLAAEPVSTGGGVVETPGDSVRLVIPAGAVSQSTTITVEPSVGHPTPTNLVPGTAYEFGPDGTQFAQPVQLTIAYDPSRLPAGTVEGTLAVYKAVGGSWQLIPGGSVDVAAKRVSAPISSFSTYGVLSQGSPSAVVVLEGNAQEAIAGTSVEVAPAVVVRTAGGQALPGVTVTFAVAAGGGSVTGASAVSDAQGIARVGSWTLGAAGANSLTATVAGVAPATITATAIAACEFAPAYTLGTTAAGRLAETDCLDATSRRADYRTLTLAAPTSLTFTLATTAFAPLVTVAREDGTPAVTQFTASPGFTRAVLPAGTYRVAARSVDTAGRGDYTLRIETASHDVVGCGVANNVFLVPGTSSQGTLRAEDCADQFSPIGDRVDGYAAWLVEGQTYAIDIQGAPLAKVALWAPNASGQLALTDVQGGASPQRIRYTAQRSGYHSLYALGQPGGTYTIALATAQPVDPCTVWSPLAVSQGYDNVGKFTPWDCRDSQNRTTDGWTLTTAASQLYEVHLAGDSVQGFTTFARDGKVLTTTYTGTGGLTRALLAPGTWQLQARNNEPSAFRLYVMRVQQVAHANGCGAQFNVFATPGSSTTGQITAEDCQDTAPMGDPTNRWDLYNIALDSGATVTATLTTSGAGSISVWGPDATGANVFFRNVPTQGAATITITHTALRTGYHQLYPLANPGMNYTIAFTVTPPGSSVQLRAPGIATFAAPLARPSALRR